MAQIPVPSFARALHAATDRDIVDIRLDVRQKSVGVEAGNHLRGLKRPAEEARRPAVPLAEGAERVHLHVVIQVLRGVEHADQVHRGRVTRPVRETLRGGFTGVTGGILLARIAERTVRHRAVAPFHAGVEVAAVAPRQPLIGAHHRVGAVIALAQARDLGVELASLAEHVAGARALQNNVDDTRDGVGAVLRRRAVTQDFDAVDHGRRDGIEVHRRGATTNRSVVVDQRARVATLAVHEHQRLIGREATQRGRAHVVRAVGHGGTWEIQRWRRRLQHLRRLDTSRCLEHRRVDHVHGHRAFNECPLTTTRAGHGHGIELRAGLFEHEVLCHAPTGDHRDTDGLARKSQHAQTQFVCAGAHRESIGAVGARDGADLGAYHADRRAL